MELKPMTPNEQLLYDYIMTASEVIVHAAVFGTESKKNYCRACSNKKHGVKSRKSFPHTCGSK